MKVKKIVMICHWSFTCILYMHPLCLLSLAIGDNAVTSSIRIAQAFPDLVGKKTRSLWKVYGGMLKYVINYALYLAHFTHIFI